MNQRKEMTELMKLVKEDERSERIRKRQSRVVYLLINR